MAYPTPERSAVADDTAANLELRCHRGDDLVREAEFTYVHRDYNRTPPVDVEEPVDLERQVFASSIFRLADLQPVDFFDIEDLPLQGLNWIRFKLGRDRTAKLEAGTYGYWIGVSDVPRDQIKTYLRGTLTIEEKP